MPTDRRSALPWLPLILLALALPLAGEPCATCKGTLEIPCVSCRGKTPIDVPCAVCDAKGTCPCPTCKGKGALHCAACEGTGRLKGIPRRCHICGKNGVTDCRVCKGGKATCASCKGRGRVSTPCGWCGERGKLPCPDCASAGIGGKCPQCMGSGKERCPACHVAKGIPTRCEACGGLGTAACETCNGRANRKCATCDGSGLDPSGHQSPGNSFPDTCPSCIGGGWTKCDICATEGAKECAPCEGRGFVDAVCWACRGSHDIPCRRCSKGKSWVVVEPKSGATVRVFLMDDFEPQASKAIPATWPTKPPWVCRVVVDAREATSGITVSSTDGWCVVGFTPNGSPIPTGPLSTPIPVPAQDHIKKYLPGWGVPPSALPFPFTTEKGKAETRLLWSMTVPEFIDRAFALRRKGEQDLPMDADSVTGEVWLRMVGAASRK